VTLLKEGAQEERSGSPPYYSYNPLLISDVPVPCHFLLAFPGLTLPFQMGRIMTVVNQDKLLW